MRAGAGAARRRDQPEIRGEISARRLAGRRRQPRPRGALLCSAAIITTPSARACSTKPGSAATGCADGSEAGRRGPDTLLLCHARFRIWPLTKHLPVREAGRTAVPSGLVLSCVRSFCAPPVSVARRPVTRRLPVPRGTSTRTFQGRCARFSAIRRRSRHLRLNPRTAGLSDALGDWEPNPRREVTAAHLSPVRNRFPHGRWDGL